MREIILAKLGEVVLKGLNRRSFEDVLLANIRRRIGPFGKFEVREAQSTVYITPQEGADLDGAEERVAKVFGIVSYSRACEVPKELDSICAGAESYLKRELLSASSFKVECRRSDKKFPMKSPEICARVGGYLQQKFPRLRVDVEHPEYTVRVEVRDFAAYVHGNARRGAGGIPVGTGGKAAVLVSGGIDSPVAAWMMARRGVELTAVHFASPPYTSERAEQKAADLLRRVGEYAGHMTLFVVPFTKIQEEIMAKCPEDYFTVIMRRFMMKAAERIARREGCQALVTGESLGQVASQTLQAIVCTDAAAEMPVFRPLIGMDKVEIIAAARRIGTYDLSILPYEDCCTVFTPKHPRTRPALEAILRAEEALDADALVRDCVGRAKTVKIEPNR
ncbi:MAG TPA: tRNA 4-thiouridine(8) synthase ThiI [Ruminococcaceae bacterium]|jgi:thiamine biosynthesis protein ThiI|nr:tRNA 4-thiouridine(8) synthase ThiI [Oscillospiraceae bacterium]HBG55991.1 tRNA 4-thiouridine(8) synthase ThiI [Oscillospiraceae bacterium]HBQ46213.1 tRNA 4-thiouridine(8) synthase ThiI [Oscillospiraceae bacterium]HBT91730.1 tRNA 4-thiouridine(8) synthase ThiI [Oscillospiraceae bacterium]HCB91567.1 tRNA 4-thiouridine(8) synthase ThiI [Oscillospiraceae bacterium]